MDDMQHQPAPLVSLSCMFLVSNAALPTVTQYGSENPRLTRPCPFTRVYLHRPYKVLRSASVAAATASAVSVIAAGAVVMATVFSGSGYGAVASRSAGAVGQ